MSMASYAETHDGFSSDASFAVLAGDAQHGFNACVELCDRWTGEDRPALRWLSKGQQEQVLNFEDLAFETGVAAAVPLFLATASCHGFELQRSIEVAGRYRLRIGWDNVEAHQQFRSTEVFGRGCELVGSCFAAAPSVEHSKILIARRKSVSA